MNIKIQNKTAKNKGRGIKIKLNKKGLNIINIQALSLFLIYIIYSAAPKEGKYQVIPVVDAKLTGTPPSLFTSISKYHSKSSTGVI